jgi:hypothetical protein
VFLNIWTAQQAGQDGRRKALARAVSECSRQPFYTGAKQSAEKVSFAGAMDLQGLKALLISKSFRHE